MRTKRRFGRVWALAVCWVSALVVVAPARPALAERPWWDEYPLILFDDNIALMPQYHANISMNGTQTGPSWGTYPLAITSASPIATLHAQGYKSISYYETFGQTGCYIAELNTATSNPTRLKATHWSWQTYAGGTIQWIGALNYFDDQAFARPYTRTHPVYGAPPLTYPDGTVAAGYNGPSTDPRNSRIFDAACSKDIYGNIGYEFEPSNPTVQSSGPHTGLLQVDGQYTGLLWIWKDSACPHWVDMDAAAVRLAASNGMDGMWSDNFSAYDSFKDVPLKAAFGDWSVALFRDYLASHFTAGELAAMGVTDVATFDIRAALRQQAAAWGGNDANIDDPVWKDARWLDHPLWQAYVVYKRRKGTEALTDYSTSVKAAAAASGVNEFMVAGNDIPIISLGWVRGNLDMVSTETQPGGYIDAGPRGILLPPVGRFQPQYKLAREHANSRFVNVWMYMRGSYSGYQGKPGVAKALHYEMLASQATPFLWPSLPDVAGTAQEQKDLFAFFQSVKLPHGARVPAEEVGLYYSSSSLLAFMTPGGFRDFSNQPHSFAYYGWGTALNELHYQYRALPEWKLTAEALAPLRVLIIPNASVLEPEKVTDVIAPWVQAGGRLMVTGDSGLRLGEDGHFAANPSGLSLAPLTGVSSMTPAPVRHISDYGAGKVLYIPDNIGMDYYNDDAQRATLLGTLATAMTDALTGAAPLRLTAPAVPSTVGLTLYEDEAARRLFVDANNYNINLSTDTITPQGAFSFQVGLPDWLDVPDVRATAQSPDGPVAVSLAPAGPARVTVNVPSLTTYASIVFDYPDADGDGLSDGTEAELGTNPASADTDADGLGDGQEVGWDGVPNAYTPGADTDPLNPDTDGDGVSDGQEVLYGHNPLDPLDFPALPLAAWPAALALLLVAGALWARRSRRARMT